MRTGRPEARLRAFFFLRAFLAFALLLFAVGLAGYGLVVRPVLDRHATRIAADLFPRAGACDESELRTRVASLAGMKMEAPGTSSSWSLLPFDSMLAEQVLARIGAPVVAESSLSRLALTFPCGKTRITLSFDRSEMLGAVPNLAFSFWIAALLCGALALAALLSRSLSGPLRKLAFHLRETPLGGEMQSAPDTGIAELNRLAEEIDSLRGRAAGAVAARSALLMGLSHDLRRPLARLRLVLDTVAEPTKDDLVELRADTRELQDALDEFMRAANAMASPVAIDGGMEGWLRLQRAYADPRLTFHGEQRACPPLNTAALVRVASNLIDNALRHTDGPVRVTWSEGGSWRLCVEDRGPGPGANAFRPFCSGNPGDGKHAGLGLALVTVLCEHNGWRLDHGPLPQGGWHFCVEGK